MEQDELRNFLITLISAAYVAGAKEGMRQAVESVQKSLAGEPQTKDFDTVAAELIQDTPIAYAKDLVERFVRF